MSKIEFNPEQMRIVLRIESNVKEEIDLIVEALQEKFPHWKFDYQNYVQLNRLPSPPSGQMIEFYQAEASFTKKKHITG